MYSRFNFIGKAESFRVEKRNRAVLQLKIDDKEEELRNYVDIIISNENIIAKLKRDFDEKYCVQAKGFIVLANVCLAISLPNENVEMINVYEFVADSLVFENCKNKNKKN